MLGQWWLVWGLLLWRVGLSGAAPSGQPPSPPTAGAGRQDRLLLEKAKILGALGLVERPNVSFPLSRLPAVVAEEAAEEAAARERARSSTTPAPLSQPSDTFLLADLVSQPPLCNASLCFAFRLTSQLLGRNVSKAHLLLKQTTSSAPPRTLRLTELTADGRLVDEGVDAALLVEGESRLSLDVSALVAGWRLSRRRTETRTLRLGEGLAGLEWLGREGATAPSLRLRTGPRALTSRIRRSDDPECSTAVHGCCKRPFYVNFADFEWDDWIIQPAGYYANYCAGDCRHRSSSSYAHVMAQVFKAAEAAGRPLSQALLPCCAPLRMRPLHIMYALGPGDVRQGQLPDMIVDACGC